MSFDSYGSQGRLLSPLPMNPQLFLKSGRWMFVLRKKQREFPKSICVQTAPQVVASSQSSPVGMETVTSPPIFDLIFLDIVRRLAPTYTATNCRAVEKCLS